MTYEDMLRKHIESKTATVVVIGFGYVGLPLAVEKAMAGFRVIAIEINPQRATMVNRGQNYIGDVVANELSSVVAKGRLRATTSFEVVQDADVITICVPTRQEQTADTSCIEFVVEQSLPHLKKWQLAMLERMPCRGNHRGRGTPSVRTGAPLVTMGQLQREAQPC